jgi:hypothetical protein
MILIVIQFKCYLNISSSRNTLSTLNLLIYSLQSVISLFYFLPFYITLCESTIDIIKALTYFVFKKILNNAMRKHEHVRV